MNAKKDKPKKEQKTSEEVKETKKPAEDTSVPDKKKNTDKPPKKPVQKDAPSQKKEEEKEKAPKLIKVDKHEAKGAKWFVIHTYSGHENKVSTNLKQRIDTMKLENKIFDVVVPTRNVVTVQHGKKEETKEKIYPGYILINMILNDETWLAVRTTPGVTTFVGAGTKPTPISKKEVEVILNYMKLEAPKYKAKFTMGEAVKIIDGPFADFLGTIETIDEEKGKVKVLVSIFGRETPVELDFLQIAKL